MWCGVGYEAQYCKEKLKRVRVAKGVVGPDRLLTWEFSSNMRPEPLDKDALTTGTGDSAISDLVCTRLAQQGRLFVPNGSREAN
jgi:hypothetical protein